MTPCSYGAHRSGPTSDIATSEKALNVKPEKAERSLTTAATQPTQIKQEAYYYAPIAFVIKTEIEHHDIFRTVLVELFNSIREHEKVTGNNHQDEKVAFADFLAHIAFLSTIPCPDFNTVFNIEFLGKTLILKENPFHQIPDKN